LNAMKASLSFALGLAIGLPVFAEAQEHDGSYYCVAEFSGGLAYDEKLKEWKGTRFRATEKFVVYFKYVGPHLPYGGGQSYTEDYFVTVTTSGSDKVETCKTYYNEASDKIEFTRDVGRGDCQTFLHRYTFGLKYKRFLSTFEWGGYAIGMDEKTDTPTISGGTCTKIR
jgi:hypothetical protein